MSACLPQVLLGIFGNVPLHSPRAICTPTKSLYLYVLGKILSMCALNVGLFECMYAKSLRKKRCKPFLESSFDQVLNKKKTKN